MSTKGKEIFQMSTTDSDAQKAVSKDQKSPTTPLLFGKKNYQLMAIGLGVIFLGYLLMMGENNTVEGGVFPAEEVYSARRIILAPIVIIAGFIIELNAIISVKKNS